MADISDICTRCLATADGVEMIEGFVCLSCLDYEAESDALQVAYQEFGYG